MTPSLQGGFQTATPGGDTEENVWHWLKVQKVNVVTNKNNKDIIPGKIILTL